MPILTNDEKQQLNTIDKTILQDRPSTSNFFDLLKGWRKFQKELHKEYGYMIYEYINDLDGRDILEEIMQMAKSSLKTKLNELIKPFDEEFYSNTIEVNAPITEYGKNPWWYRIPKEYSEAFKSDLKIYGVQIPE